MRLSVFDEPKRDGKFETMLDGLEDRFPNVRADVQREFLRLSAAACPVPCGAGIAQVPGKFGRAIVKIRVPSSDMKVGKSGGFRVLVASIAVDKWRPIAIYAKSDRDNLPANEIARLLEIDDPRGDA